MNNENKTRMRTTWLMICVTILTLFITGNNAANALTAGNVVYNSNILYINKYSNLVNIKDTIYIKYINNKVKIKKKTLYLINDRTTRSNFLMPAYSLKLNSISRVDKRVIISRLANAIKSQETGGIGAYTRHSYSSSACGAYQYMPSTWGNFMGYKNPCKAPAWVQDAKIVSELQWSYKHYGTWAQAVAAHLSPSRAWNVKSWSRPMPGNPTVLEYVQSVFKKANIALAC